MVNRRARGTTRVSERILDISNHPFSALLGTILAILAGIIQGLNRQVVLGIFLGHKYGPKCDGFRYQNRVEAR